ncbi:MAG: glycogen/starch/alpha-glucan phosphorylase, partial [Spirochaetes bacterium]|nr:glycogen/starch/alpha-glucan phosphorylase [Spirochaetota bacterium]
LYRMRALVPLSADGEFQTLWRTVKRKNKEAFRDYIRNHNNIEINIDSIFDCHVKRLHEYKRQLLNVLHVITLYNRIKAAPGSSIVPRTIIFSGKAAPGYYMAKLIIKLINSIADIVNNDPDLGNKLKVVFLRNYAVSNAEKIIPAADLSEQISTAGTEASGTGNMKFALNGALTIGTLDGANIEIMEEVGGENIFIFGLNAGEAANLRNSGYNPYHYYENNSELRQVIDMIKGGYFSPFDKGLFVPITDSLLYNGDRYMLLADYESYVKCQEMVSSAYRDEKKWTRMSILNVAGMGKFSTDRTIKEYAEEIWNAKPVTIKIKDNDKNQL